MKKRFAAIFLSLCMVLALMPSAAFAAEPGGQVTVTIPIEITVDQNGDGVPGEHTVELEFSSWFEDHADDVTIEGDPFTISGAGKHTREVKITGPADTIEEILRGLEVKLADTYEAGWKNPDTQYTLAYVNGQLEIYSSDIEEPVKTCSFGLTYQEGAYNLYVGGTRVTTDNAGDVLGDGTVSYDERANTLTLSGASVSAQDMPYGIYAENDLTIVLEGENSVSVSGEFFEDDLAQLSGTDISAAIYSGGNLTIREGAGSGTLNASASALMEENAKRGLTSSGIYASGNLTLEDVSVEASGGDVNVEYDVSVSTGIECADVLTVSGGDLTARSGDVSSGAKIRDSEAISGYDGVLIENGAVVDAQDGEGMRSRAVWTAESIRIDSSQVKAQSNAVSDDTDESYGIQATMNNTTENNITITGSTVTASAGVGSVRADGIYAKDNITITDSQVTADGVSDYEKAPAYGGGIFSDAGNITISGEDTVIKAYSGYGQNGIAGISAEGGNITITDKADVTALAAVFNEYDEADYGPAFTTSDGGSVGDGIRAAGDITIDDATVLALGCEANYSSGIFSETGDITIESGNVNAYGGRAVNHTDPESAGSAGISAEAGNVTINGGEVVAEVGLSEHGIADGIRAHADISIGGGKVTAVGALSSVDGVEPEYSGGIFSETGDITITGKDTVVEAGGGYAEKGSTAIGAEAGNLIIKDGKVRADGAYPVTSDTGFANGFSSVKADDGTGGNIIISGGDFEAIGYTDSVYCEGDLMASPDGTQITMKVLGELIFDIDSWEPDWDKMYDEAGEIEGSPFTSEMIVAADSTAGMQYFGGSSLAYDPAGDGTDDPAGSEDPGDASGQDSSNAKTSDDMNLIFWTILMLAGGCAATGIVACNRRKR